MSVIWFYIIDLLTKVLLLVSMSTSVHPPPPPPEGRVGWGEGWYFRLILLVATSCYLPSVISYAVYNKPKRKGLLTRIWAVSLPSCGTDWVGVAYGLHTQRKKVDLDQLLGSNRFEQSYVKYQQKTLFTLWRFFNTKSCKIAVLI